MHVPDGFLDAPTSAVTGAVAVAGVAVALRKARAELDDRTAPMAGLVAAFVFAGQMMNFPVGAGTSGHLLGGALAAVLVGPWTGALCISVVLGVQALFMADGGITALGTNIVLMALVGCFGGYLVFRGALAVLPRRLRTAAVVAPAAAVGALVSVPLAAAVFTGLFAVGGTADVDLSAVLTAMLGWHTVIGVGEAVLTGLVVGAVVASRPDLVHGARLVRGSGTIGLDTPSPGGSGYSTDLGSRGTSGVSDGSGYSTDLGSRRTSGVSEGSGHSTDLGSRGTSGVSEGSGYSTDLGSRGSSDGRIETPEPLA